MKNFFWHAPEYPHKEKSSDWYWTIGIISAALVVTSIIFGNVLFGLVLGIGAFTLTMLASRKPGIVSVEINDKGVAVDKTLYPFAAIDSFYMPLIAVPVRYKDLEELRTFLSSHLKEEVFEQGIIQTIFDRLGF